MSENSVKNVSIGLAKRAKQKWCCIDWLWECVWDVVVGVDVL